METILEEGVLKRCEVREIVDNMPDKSHFCENKKSTMNTVGQLKDEVGGENCDVGGDGFEEEHKELFTYSPLLQEFKTGMCKAMLNDVQLEIKHCVLPGPILIGTNPGTSRRARLTILPQPCASPVMVTVRWCQL